MELPESRRDTELDELNHLRARIMGCATQIHRVLGLGLLEETYDAPPGVQHPVPILDQAIRGGDYRLPLLVQDSGSQKSPTFRSSFPDSVAQLLAGYGKESRPPHKLQLSSLTRRAKIGLSLNIDVALWLPVSVANR